MKDPFARIRPRYAESESRFAGVEAETFESQIPGGMISTGEPLQRRKVLGRKLEARLPMARLPSRDHPWL